MVAIFIITFLFLLLSFLGLASGVLLNKKCIKGSCGGIGVTQEGQNLSCDTCPNKAD